MVKTSMILKLENLKISLKENEKTQPHKSKLKPKPHAINKYDTFCLPDKVLWVYMENSKETGLNYSPE